MPKKNETTEAAPVTPEVPVLTEEEVRAEFAKLAEQRARAKARYAEYANKPETKARQAAYSAKAKARRKALLEAAEKLGLKF